MGRNSKQELQRLARRLYRRRREGVIVPFVAVSLEDWKPQEQDCHANVNHWVLANDCRCSAVRGWTYIAHSLRGCPSFVAHSVVETEDGNLIDITPTQARRRFPFIRDKGRRGEYFERLEKHGLIYLDYHES